MNWSQGIQQRPLDLSDLGISLSDFKIITMLIDDENHTKVGNLTGEQVDSMDAVVDKLKMDT